MQPTPKAPSRPAKTDPVPVSGERIAQVLPAMVGFWSRDLICKFANVAYGAWFGRSPDKMLGCQFQDLLGPHLFALNEPHVAGVLDGREQRFDRTLVKADGSIGHTLVTYVPQRDANGSVIGFVDHVMDVTPLEESRRALSLASVVLHSMAEGVLVTDLGGRIVSVNPAFTTITGYDAAESIGCKTHFLSADRDNEHLRALVFKEFAANGPWRGEVWVRRKDGQHFLAEQTTSLAREGGRPKHYVSLFRDVTQARLASDEPDQQTHDGLTGLPNRKMLSARLQALTTPGATATFAVVLLDLTRFKQINDRHGRDFGDHVLQIVAARLNTFVRQAMFLAHLGEDKFAVIVTGMTLQDPVAKFAAKMARRITPPIKLRAAKVTIAASIGIAHWPRHAKTAPGLLAHAAAALDAAKKLRHELPDG